MWWELAGEWHGMMWILSSKAESPKQGGPAHQSRSFLCGLGLGLGVTSAAVLSLSAGQRTPVSLMGLARLGLGTLPRLSTVPFRGYQPVFFIIVSAYFSHPRFFFPGTSPGPRKRTWAKLFEPTLCY